MHCSPGRGQGQSGRQPADTWLPCSSPGLHEASGKHQRQDAPQSVTCSHAQRATQGLLPGPSTARGPGNAPLHRREARCAHARAHGGVRAQKAVAHRQGGPGWCGATAKEPIPRQPGAETAGSQTPAGVPVTSVPASTRVPAVHTLGISGTEMPNCGTRRWDSLEKRTTARCTRGERAVGRDERLRRREPLGWRKPGSPFQRRLEISERNSPLS